MTCSHHSADKPLDVTAVMRAGDRSVDEIDAMLGRTPREGSSPEFPGVIEMNSGG